MMTQDLSPLIKKIFHVIFYVSDITSYFTVSRVCFLPLMCFCTWSVFANKHYFTIVKSTQPIATHCHHLRYTHVTMTGSVLYFIYFLVFFQYRAWTHPVYTMTEHWCCPASVPAFNMYTVETVVANRQEMISSHDIVVCCRSCRDKTEAKGGKKKIFHI